MLIQTLGQLVLPHGLSGSGTIFSRTNRSWKWKWNRKWKVEWGRKVAVHRGAPNFDKRLDITSTSKWEHQKLLKAVMIKKCLKRYLTIFSITLFQKIWHQCHRSPLGRHTHHPTHTPPPPHPHTHIHTPRVALVLQKSCLKWLFFDKNL
jgi:hypothetical protein